MRVIEVDGRLDESLAEYVAVEVDVGLRVAGHRRDVVQSLDWLHDVHLLWFRHTTFPIAHSFRKGRSW